MLFSASTELEHAQMYADLGYDALDVNMCGLNLIGERHNSFCDGEDWKERVDAARELCYAMGLKIHSIHMPYKYQFTDENYAMTYEMMCRALIAADRMGAEWAVMHVKPIEQMVELVKKLLADTKVEHVKIAFENSSNKTLNQVIEIHDILKAERYPVGICLDIGHCHKRTSYDYDVVEKIYEMGDRIKMLHIHDNFRDDDSHSVPFIGTVPWQQVMEALKDIGYAGAFNYKIAMHPIPEPLQLSYAKYCVEVAQYLMKIFEEHVPR